MDPSKELSSLLDRSDADVRGVKKRISSGSGDSSVPVVKAGQSANHTRQGSTPSQASDNLRSMNDILLTSRSTGKSDVTGKTLLSMWVLFAYKVHTRQKESITREMTPDLLKKKL